MSTNLKYPLIQASCLNVNPQVFPPIKYKDTRKSINTPADYLFFLVTYFKESNSLPKELLHQLQKLAELQEREEQEIAHKNGPIDFINIYTSTRHIKFNDFFTLNFNN